MSRFRFYILINKSRYKLRPFSPNKLFINNNLLRRNKMCVEKKAVDINPPSRGRGNSCFHSSFTLPFFLSSPFLPLPRCFLPSVKTALPGFWLGLFLSPHLQNLIIFSRRRWWRFLNGEVCSLFYDFFSPSAPTDWIIFVEYCIFPTESSLWI